MTKPSNEKRGAKKRAAKNARKGVQQESNGPKGPLGARFYEARKAKGFHNRAALARELGLEPITLYRIEMGLTTHPEPVTLTRLSVKLDVDESWLLHGVGKGPTKPDSVENATRETFTASVERYLSSEYGGDTPPETALKLRALDWSSVGLTQPEVKSIHRTRELIEFNQYRKQSVRNEKEDE